MQKNRRTAGLKTQEKKVEKNFEIPIDSAIMSRSILNLQSGIAKN
jgi:hypothetical protein